MYSQIGTPFQLFKVDPVFLGKPVSDWEGDESYKRFCFLVDGLSPINDAGERAVKFASDFNGRITHNPKQHQAMMHGVQQHRRENPKATKKQ